MKIKWSVILVFFLIINSSFGQVEYLKLTTTNCSDRSPFSKINIIDNRTNPNTLGFIQTGAFNKLTAVGYKGNFIDSLSEFFISHDSIRGEKRELTIILNEIFLGEQESKQKWGEFGRNRLHVRLFETISDDKYVEILDVDTLYLCSSGWDVTNKLLRTVSEHFCEIAKESFDINIKDKDKLPAYSLNDLKVLDSIEKKNLPMFNNDKPKAGIYKTFDSFKMNSPENVSIEIDKSDSSNLKVYKTEIIKSKKKKTNLNFEDIYAVSDGTVFIKATSLGFYELKKINTDYYFYGRTSLINYDNSVMWGAMFGVIGYGIAKSSDRTSALFLFKLNYKNGNSMPIEKLKN